MDQLAALRHFVRIVEAGSITVAAEQLGVAKSAVSRRLSELESRLGVRLLQRSTRRMVLTDAGQAYFVRAQRILEDLAEADAEVSGAQAQLSGRLRIAAPLSFGVRQLGPVLSRFAAQYPGLSLDLDLNDRTVDIVGEGFDLAIRIGQLNDSSLQARRLTTIRHVLCATPAYWDRHGRPQHPDDLSGHSILRYSNVSQLGWPYRGPDGADGELRLKSTIQANNGDFLMAAALQGLGLMIQPCFIVDQAVAQGVLEPALCDFQWRELAAYAVYPANRHLPVRIRALIEFLSRQFGDPPVWDRCLSCGAQ